MVGTRADGGAEYVRAAHDAFLQAGADIVTTNSYAIVPFHIGADVFKARASELLRLSGKLARAAADDAGRPVRVAASVPPMFGSYQPEKFDPHVAADMMRLFYDELADYADLFLAETLGSVAEAELFLTEFMPIRSTGMVIGHIRGCCCQSWSATVAVR